MARILRLSTFQRNVLACIALFIVINILIISEYSVPRKLALSLDDIYDPLPSSSYELDSNSLSSKNASQILLVSALFLLPKSRVSKEQYLDYLSRFLGPITTDIYFFTTPDLAASIAAARGPGLQLTIDTSFSSPFDIPPLKGREAVYSAMHTLDGERGFHVPELYAIRNAKPFFVERAVEGMRNQKKEYDYVFWSDASSFPEEHFYTTWPDPARVGRVWDEGSKLAGREKRDLVFVPMLDGPPKSARDWMEDLGPVEAHLSQGSFFGGSPTSMTWFSRTFYAYHDHFVKLGYAPLLTSDSMIYNALFLLYPERFITVWMSDPSAPARGGLPPAFLGYGHLGACGDGDGRYYYQWWLSGRETRERMRGLWMAKESQEEKEDGRRWWDWNLSLRVKVPCRFTRVLVVEGVLRSVFGERWRKPVASVMKPTRTW